MSSSCQSQHGHISNPSHCIKYLKYQIPCPAKTKPDQYHAQCLNKQVLSPTLSTLRISQHSLYMVTHKYLGLQHITQRNTLELSRQPRWKLSMLTSRRPDPELHIRSYSLPRFYRQVMRCSCPLRSYVAITSCLSAAIG